MDREADRRERAEEIFHDALERPQDERRAFVEEVCGDDADLRADVDSLLAHREDLGSFLAEPVLKADPGDTVASTDVPPHETIGPYRLLRMLGRGGMGEVWLAEQKQPIRRRVALKIIKKGMDSREVIARFESERQALALMEHPSVARVLDAGSTDDGAPFFVMEYVEGAPITEYADHHRLDTGERLRLFQRVCDGVQHAHQKAILHRDLKPSNILVTQVDDEAVPKIIDFGVAKATGQKLTEKTMFTQIGAVIGTPEYMSPEQATLGEDRVDTRSDVYSLGVLLYELLVGVLPFETDSLRAAGLERIFEILRTEVPSRPSTRMRQMGDRSTETARFRGGDRDTLIRRLRGDLDWITMKALEKEPARRYGSPQELAADIERHLTNQPVAAGPPSISYRAGKYLRRHALGASFAAVAVVLLIAGIAGTSMGLLRARQESRTAQRVAESMTDLLRGAAPSVTLGRDATMLREMMERSVQTWERDLADAPGVEAELLMTVGEVQIELGDFENVRRHMDRALELWTEVHGPRHPDLARALRLRGIAHRELGDFESADADLTAAVEIQREALGPSPELASALAELGNLRMATGAYQESEAIQREALDMRQRLLGDDDRATAQSWSELSQTLGELGNFAEAESLQRRALGVQRTLFEPPHPAIATAIENLASILDYQGQSAEAESLYREVVSMRRTLFGDIHPDLAIALSQLGRALGRQRKLDEAIEVNRESLEMKRAIYGNRHPDTATSMNYLAAALDRAHRFDEALALYEECLEVRRETLGDDHTRVATVLNNIAFVQMAKEDYESAVPALREAVDIFRSALGPGHRNVCAIGSNLGISLFRLDRYDEALDVLWDCYQKAGPGWGEDHIVTAKSLAYHGAALARTGRAVEAEPQLLEAHEVLARTRGAESNYAQFVVEELIALYEGGGLDRSADARAAAAEEWRAHRAVASP